MELTVGYLKKVLEQVDDNVVLATLELGNDSFDAFINEKRLIVVKDVSHNKNWGGRTFLAINGMGSHFTGNGQQKGLEWTGQDFHAKTFEK